MMFPALAPGYYLALHPAIERPVIVEPPAGIGRTWMVNGEICMHDPREYGWILQVIKEANP